MPHSYDAASQYLASFEPSDWPAILGIETSATITPIVTDLSTVSARADVVLRIDEQEPCILVIEFQAGPEKKLPPGRRFAGYSLLAEDQLGLPVWVEVVQLRRKANSPELTGVFRRSLPNGKCYHEFHYGVTRVWEQPVEKFLKGGLGTLPLAVLTDEAMVTLADVLVQIKGRIDREIPIAEQPRFWAATGVLMGLRYKFDDYNPLLEKIMDLRDSTFIQHYARIGRKKGFQEGELEGKRIGELKGELKAKREILLKLGTARLGSPSDTVRESILAIEDRSRLDQLIELLIEATSWDELFPEPK